MPTNKRTALTPQQEARFQKWYQEKAAEIGINKDPDDPKHHYDYRGAWLGGYGPDSKQGNHWPSEYKDDDHPNRFVDGMDTKPEGQ